SVVMWLSIIAVSHVLGWNSEGVFGERLLFLTVAVVVGLAVFALSSLILGSSEAKSLLKMRNG
ncbi:MAG: hypothetical protein U9N37_00980, partial [Thermodesulfobacteriota bacterium]|nr:hypothetical protein [Thermodesulfobacteriota bacterium]